MKTFKTTLLALTLTLVFAPLVQSCLHDNDDYYLAIATFRTTKDNDYYFTLDNGETMYAQQPTHSKLEDGQRVYVYFDILDEKVSGYDYNIEVEGIVKILTKDVIAMDETTADSIGDDKVNITALWFGDGYLNVKFQFEGTRNPTDLHMVNLVRNDIEGANDNEEAGYIGLEFRHNAFDDYEAEVLNGIVSFKGPFTEKEMKGLKIRYRSIYDGVKYIKIDFKEDEKPTAGFFFSGSNMANVGSTVQ